MIRLYSYSPFPTLSQKTRERLGNHISLLKWPPPSDSIIKTQAPSTSQIIGAPIICSVGMTVAVLNHDNAGAGLRNSMLAADRVSIPRAADVRVGRWRVGRFCCQLRIVGRDLVRGGGPTDVSDHVLAVGPLFFELLHGVGLLVG